MARVPTSLLRDLAVAALGAAAYGAAIGASKNATYAWRSAIKLPLLLLGTAGLCALATFVCARFAGVALRFTDLQRATLALCRGLAALLASLAPVSLFLGRTMVQPSAADLGGYPAFVTVNMLFIATAGGLASIVHVRILLRRHGVPLRGSLLLTGTWLALSLLVGGQLAFWLRPYFGIASLTGAPPFALGDAPTVTGARNFYEVVWQFVGGAAAAPR